MDRAGNRAEPPACRSKAAAGSPRQDPGILSSRLHPRLSAAASRTHACLLEEPQRPGPFKHLSCPEPDDTLLINQVLVTFHSIGNSAPRLDTDEIGAGRRPNAQEWETGIFHMEPSFRAGGTQRHAGGDRSFQHQRVL